MPVATVPVESGVEMNGTVCESAPVSRGILLLFVAVVVTVASLGGTQTVRAQSGETGGSYLEAEAQAIDRMLMCPVCPAQTIDQTEVPLAKQMRAQVRELLASGATREEVLDWFAAPERYGPSVRAEPPRSGINLIAWIVPGVAVIAGMSGGVLTLRAMRRRAVSPIEALQGEEADDLQPYLSAVDRDLALNADSERSDG